MNTTLKIEVEMLEARHNRFCNEATEFRNAIKGCEDALKSALESEVVPTEKREASMLSNALMSISEARYNQTKESYEQQLSFVKILLELQEKGVIPA